MLKRSKALVGLELDPSAVRAVVKGPSGDVRRAVERPLDPGIISDGGVADPAALAAELRALFADGELPPHVRIGVASQRVLVRPMDLPVIEKADELAVAVRFHAQDALPMPLEGAVLDFVRLGLVDTPEGPRTRVMLVAARRDMITEVLTAVRAAGLRPDGIDLAAFAMVRSLAPPNDGDRATLYLSIGGLTNVAIAVARSCVFTRVVGQGLEAIAVELAERRGCPRQDAYAALIEHGFEGEPEVATVLAGGLRRLSAEVRTTLDFHAAGNPGTRASRCVLTGPALDVPGLLEELARDLAMPIEPGEVAGDVDARFATAAGLCTVEAAA